MTSALGFNQKDFDDKHSEMKWHLLTRTTVQLELLRLQTTVPPTLRHADLGAQVIDFCIRMMRHIPTKERTMNRRAKRPFITNEQNCIIDSNADPACPSTR